MASLATAWVDIVPRFKDLSSTFNRELRGIDATGAGSRLGSQLGDGLTAGAKTGGTKLSDMLTGVTKSAVTGFGKIGKVGLGAITTIGGGITALAAKGGFARALNIENAQAKLKGLGHSAETIGEIMANANLAVKGTAYGLDEAASVAAAAVASGIKPGEQLTQVLKTVGDTAQIVGMGFSDAGAIFTSVMARGKLQGDDMLQLWRARLAGAFRPTGCLHAGCVGDGLQRQGGLPNVRHRVGQVPRRIRVGGRRNLLRRYGQRESRAQPCGAEGRDPGVERPA
jgi:hypothetical protein